MLTVRFYTLSKKENSTKQPGINDAYTEFSCLLKAGTGVITPALEIRTDQNPSVWNYAYIVEFQRYYFIQEWTWNVGAWIVSMHVDALASWKTQIGSSTQYIMRAADTSITNGNIIDTFPITEACVDQSQKTFGSSLSLDVYANTPRYVIGVINADATYQPFTTSYYALTYSQMNTLRRLLLTDISYIGNVDSAATNVEINKAKVDINPYQYIIFCKYFPFDIDVLKDGQGLPITTTIKLGWWSTNATGYYISAYYKEFSYTTTIDQHPQIARGFYLSSSQFSSYMFDWAGFHFNIPGTNVQNATHLEVKLTVDIATGLAHCRLLPQYTDGSVPVVWSCGEQTQDFAVNIPIAQITWEGGKGVSFVNAGAGLMQTITGNQNVHAGDSMYGMAALIGGDNFGGTYNSQPGSLAAIRAHQAPMLSWQFVFVAERSIADEGLPVCKEKQISSIASGYILCRSAHLSLPCTEPEQHEVISYLDGGFFYE